MQIDPALLDTTYDVRATVRPGGVNAHTHLYSGLAPLGMPAPARPPASFLEILESVWWRLDRSLDEASLRASARLYVAEALLAGTTTLVDHHESPRYVDGSLDVLAEEAGALGARLVVAYGATERNGGRDEGRRGLAECARFIRAGRFPLAKGLIGLHASFTVSDDTIREAGALAAELGTAVHVHVAEDIADVADARRRGFAGPLERLIALGALPSGSLVAHGVHLDEAAVRRVEDAGAFIVQNPRSNANNRVGYPLALRASRNVALGTDGFPADMHAEHLALLDQARLHGDPATPAQLDARRTGGWRLAARFGTGRPDSTGEDTSGDLVVGRAGAPPRTVLVGGVPVVRDGRLVRGDIDAIRAHASEQALRLWSRMAAL